MPSTPPALPLHNPPPPPTPSNSIYQSLTTSATNGDSEYAGLNEITRARTISGIQFTTPPTSSLSPQGAEYMGLSSITRVAQEPAYMDLNASKT